MRKFSVNNIRCEKCAQAIKNALEDDFGEVVVDLEADPRTVSLNIKDEQVSSFKETLEDLGFDVIEEIK